METAVTPVVPTTSARSFVEWSPIIAGAVLAGSLSFVFLTFGAAIGLSATSPWPNTGLSASAAASIAVFWALAQQIGCFLAGGYVAGRMRSRWHESHADEVAFRDGLHGGLVWATGILVAAVLGATAAVTLASAGAQATVGLANTTTAASAMESVVDTALRPANVSQPPPADNEARSEDVRGEMGRLLASTIASSESDQSSVSYMAALVARQTGATQQEAEQRVSAAIAAARDAVDKARKATALTGFLTALGLMVSLGAAWWAARKGGKHRDEAVPARFTLSRPMRASP